MNKGLPWFEEKFVDDVCGKNLTKIESFVEDSGADHYLKLNELILLHIFIKL